MDIIEYDYQELAKKLYQAKQELISKNRIAKKELLDFLSSSFIFAVSVF